MARAKKALAPVEEASEPATAAAPVATGIRIEPMDIRLVEITLVGDSPLITHAWSEKARRMMLEKQMKAAKQPKEARDPQEEYESAKYRLPDGGYGFPANAFKAAAVNACTYVDGLTKVAARGAFHIVGDMVRIEADEPVMRSDMVRIGMGTADTRFRPEFSNWRAKLTIRLNVRVLSPEQLVNLFDIAGFGVGIGEWRPQTEGSFGMFHVLREGE